MDPSVPATPLSGPRRLRRRPSSSGVLFLGPPPSRRRFWLASADASREPRSGRAGANRRAPLRRDRAVVLSARCGIALLFPGCAGLRPAFVLCGPEAAPPTGGTPLERLAKPLRRPPCVRIHAAFAQHRDAERDCSFRRPLCRPLNVRSRLRIVRARMRQGVFSSKFVQSRDEFVRIRLGDPLFRGGEAARSFWEGVLALYDVQLCQRFAQIGA